MKKLLYIFLGLMWVVTIYKNYELKEILSIQHSSIERLYIKIDSLSGEIDTMVYDRELNKHNVSRSDILKAIIVVESQNNDLAYAESENAAGCLQIRPIMVREVNRILKMRKLTTEYTLIDRWNRQKSIEMFNIFINYYNLTTAEEIARGWNGGPRGILKSTTMAYWGKVENELISI